MPGNFMVHISDEMFTDEDKKVTHADLLRMQTMIAGDAVSDYNGFPEVQVLIIAEEKARNRLMGALALMNKESA